MWPYHPELLETPVPRYTSFPTAAELSDDVGAAELDHALQTVSGDISLYVHIPFCEQICWYCGCNTGASNRRERLSAYLESLHREIAIVSARLGDGVKVRRIAFGGGSPNAISPTDFVRIVTELTLHFTLCYPEWSIELDPRSLSPEWGPVLEHVGITRASLGVQTFAPHLQAAIGRIQPDSDIGRANDMLRANGITSLNFDLMYGLPGQSWDDLESTLLRAIVLGVDRIALFGYAHVPHIIPRQRRIDASQLPDQQARFAMAALGHDLLVAAGYQQIGFDHFALPDDPLAQAQREGRLHRNFRGYTDDGATTLIGLGASAISCLPGLIVQNEKKAGRYRMMLSQDILPASMGIVRSSKDQATGHLIEQLLCHGEAQVRPDQWQLCGQGIQPFIAHGLVQVEVDKLRILSGGWPYARTIAALFDPYRQHSPRRFSSAV